MVSYFDTPNSVRWSLPVSIIIFMVLWLYHSNHMLQYEPRTSNQSLTMDDSERIFFLVLRDLK